MEQQMESPVYQKDPAALPEPLSPFLPSTSIQIAWDSTSLGWLKTCPRLYQYSMIEGWRSRGQSVHLDFGQYYHHALELYDRHRATGQDHAEALYESVKYCLEVTWLYDTETAPPEDGLPPNAVNIIHPGRPLDWGHNLKTRETLVRSVIWYLEEFGENDAAQTVVLANGKPAVELSFRLELDFGPGGPNIYDIDPSIDKIGYKQHYILSGHLDRVVEFSDGIYVMDRKAQPLSTCVLSLNGWEQIKNLKIGDLVATKNGNFVKIKGLFPKGITKVYRVSFNDRTSVLCAEDHLWTVGTQFAYDGWKTLSLQELLIAPSYKKFEVPIVKPIQHPERELTLDPYILGALLGDGYLAGSSISMSTGKQWLADKIKSRLPKGDIIKKSPANNYSWPITGGHVLSAIKNLGLWGKLSAAKFIPKDYLFASEQQRRDLLQGLLDTDGSWNGKSRRYQSMSKRLIEDICALVRSLGGTARWIIRTDGCFRASIRMPDMPTGIGHRYIKAIERVEDDETMCIEVDSKDGLYVTENYIVTHNTSSTTIGSYFFDGFAPDNQMSLYTFASKVIYQTPVRGVIIDAAQIAVGFTRFSRGFTFRTEAQTEEWLENTRHWLALAEQYAVAGFWPMQDKACHMYGGCTFRKVCSKSPEVRQKFLESDFTKRHWNPLEPR